MSAAEVLERVRKEKKERDNNIVPFSIFRALRDDRNKTKKSVNDRLKALPLLPMSEAKKQEDKVTPLKSIRDAQNERLLREMREENEKQRGKK